MNLKQIFRLGREMQLSISGLEPSYRCPHVCSHCCMKLTPNGYQMSFASAQLLFSFEDLRFQSHSILSGGDCFHYYDDGKNVSHLVELFLQKGVESVSINTAGFGPNSRIPLEAASGLSQYGGKVFCVLSVNMFQGKRDDYWKKLSHTIETVGQANIPITALHTVFSKETEAETLEFVAALVEKYNGKGLSENVWVESGSLEKVGRGERLRGAVARDISKRVCTIHEKTSEGRTFSIGPRGDLSPCVRVLGEGMPPFANVFEHTWEGIADRYKSYVEQFDKHQKINPNGVARCVWHRQMVFRPPAPKKSHLRARPLAKATL